MRLIAETPRFVIRDFEPEEEETYLSLFEDEQVTLHLPKRTPEEHRQRFIDTLKEYADGSVLGCWGMFNNADNDFIGFCMLREYAAGEVELGYALNRKFWGNGIAGEMAKVMIDYAFAHTGANKIVGVTTLENIASQRVLEKAGLKRMDNFVRDGEELAFFSIGT